MEGTVIFKSAYPLTPLRYKDGPPRPVSWGGMSFEPDERGVIMVPVEAVRELTESHGMEGVPAHVEALIEQTVQRAVTEALAERQGTDGGAVRPAVFPPQGDHPEGGLPQPALTEIPDEKAIQASQSETLRPPVAEEPPPPTKVRGKPPTT